MNLLDQIERAAHDSSRTLADALRACLFLGSRAGSPELTEWATKELRGYDVKDEIPAYRKIVAPLLLDGVAGNMLVSQQSLSPMELPDFVRESGLDENLTLINPVAELEVSAKQQGGVKFSIPMGADLAAYMTHAVGNPYNRIDRIYWSVSPTTITGVIDQIRTTLVELVVQIRQESRNAKNPSADAVTNSVAFTVYGKRNRVTVNAAQSSGSGSAAVTAKPDDGPSTWWTTARIIGAVIVGVAAIASAYFGWLAIK